MILEVRARLLIEPRFLSMRDERNLSTSSVVRDIDALGCAAAVLVPAYDLERVFDLASNGGPSDTPLLDAR